MIFNYSEEELKNLKGFDTLNEIHQQPNVFLEIINIIKVRVDEIKKFLTDGWFNKNDTKIIFTGAGTSEFVGNSIVHNFIKEGYDAQSIATTDIVQGIEEYVSPNKKTLLVSFARSGNSPESVATFDMMTDYVKDIKHLVITCNSEGELAKRSEQTNGNFVFLLPPEANDKSFAMTSSYTGMMLTAELFFEINNFDKLVGEVETLSKEMTSNMNKHFSTIMKLAELNHKRVIYLGSGDLNGIAQESHLKMLELTAGEIAMFFNSPMGFRHGPKSILNKESVVIMYFNSDPYKRQYDFDLLKEFSGQNQVDKIIVVDHVQDNVVEKLCHEYIVFNHSTQESLMGLNYVTFAQLFGFYKSISIGKTPDNPWPSGEVNRVVQGVVIHKK